LSLSWFDHGIALSIIRILIVPRACEFVFNGGSFWTEITDPRTSYFGGISYVVTPALVASERMHHPVWERCACHSNKRRTKW